MTQWDKVELMRPSKTQVDAAIKTDRMKPNDAMKLLPITKRFCRNTLTSVLMAQTRATAGELFCH